MKYLDEIAEIRIVADRLRDNLPKSLDIAALGVKSKAPFQLLCTREALIWRTEELARNACNALERDDLTVAAILTRALMESAALAWKLMEVIEERNKYTLEKLNSLLMRLLAGSNLWTEAPNPVNVIECLRQINKKIPGVLTIYESLSEIAHPNWMGVAGLYSVNDELNFVTHFGQNLRAVDELRAKVPNATLASLGAFEYAYNRISDQMPVFLSELESF